MRYGIYLPEKILNNIDLEKKQITLQGGKLLLASQIFQKIGVERRHISPNTQTVADMGYLAAKSALQNNPQIDLILASTSHPTPYHLAGDIKKRLKLNNAQTLDFHAACSGSALMFSYLLENIEIFNGKKILLIASEKFSNSIVDLSHPDAMKLDPSLGQTIFGDGAAALQFTLGQEIVIHCAINQPIPDPDGKTDLILMAMGDNTFIDPCVTKPVALSPKHTDYPNGYFSQNGPKVFQNVQAAIPNLVKDAVKKANLTSKDISLVIVHSGSKRVVEALQQRLAPDFTVCSDYADSNMSSVSLLYSFIKALQQKKITKGNKLVLAGFGAGSPHLYSSITVIELK